MPITIPISKLRKLKRWAVRTGEPSHTNCSFHDEGNPRDMPEPRGLREDPNGYVPREAGVDGVPPAEARPIRALPAEHASTKPLLSTASASSSSRPSPLPESPIASTSTSDSPFCRSLPSPATHGTLPASSPSSMSDCANPHGVSTHVNHDDPPTVSAASILESREPSGHGQTEPCDDVFEASDAVTDGPFTLAYEGIQSTLDEVPLSDSDLSSHSEGASETSPLIPSESIDEQFIRDIRIIYEESDGVERTRRYRMKIDTANEHKNLISRRVVEELGLHCSHRNPLFWKRVLNKVAPWPETAKAAKEQARTRLLNCDGTVIRGQDGIVEISWYVRNQGRIRDPFLFFNSARRYTTTHVVTDSPENGYDIILAWNEVDSLKLRKRHVAPIYQPPTTTPDPSSKTYKDYEQRLAKNKAAREEKRRNDKSHPPGASSAKKPDKQQPSQS